MNLRLIQRVILQQLATNMGKKQHDMNTWQHGYVRARDDVDGMFDRLVRAQEKSEINWREDK